MNAALHRRRDPRRWPSRKCCGHKRITDCETHGRTDRIVFCDLCLQEHCAPKPLDPNRPDPWADPETRTQ